MRRGCCRCSGLRLRRQRRLVSVALAPQPPLEAPSLPLWQHQVHLRLHRPLKVGCCCCCFLESSGLCGSYLHDHNLGNATAAAKIHGHKVDRA